MKTTAELALAAVFAAARPVLPGGSDVADARVAAFDRFAGHGLPHRRLEAWKHTDLRTLMRDAMPLAAPPGATARVRASHAAGMLSDVGGRRLVLVDGAFAADLSDLAGLDDGLTITSMAQALGAGDALLCAQLGKAVSVDDPMLALNTALMGDGVVIRVAPRLSIERPLQIVSVTTGDVPAAMFTRSLMVLEAGACATLIETHEGPDHSPYQVNSALELVLGETARLDHVKIIREGSAALHVATLLADIKARAALNDFSFMTGGAIVRNQLYVRCLGEGTVVGIRGASLLAGRQHADTTLVVDHRAGGGQSRELFKAVVDDEARAVFQGKITVQPNAQQTDARMMSRALLLSQAAEADSKPELEIFADDVQCGHGSTAGALDEQLKFYLMARGIPAKQAEAVLIEAFVGEAVEAIGQERVRNALMSATISWLQARG